jgi:esterase/lipase
LEKGYVVYLMAYSFSVGIAAKLCVEFPSIEKLVLVSPTIYIVKTGLLPGYVKMLGKRMEFNRKYRKEKKHQAVIKKTKANNTGVVKLAFRISHAILKYRKYLKEIRCKMLLIKGKKDELSIPQTFTYITKKTEKAITMIKVYPEENHIMIMSLSHGKRAYDDILRFVYHFSSGEENEDL